MTAVLFGPAMPLLPKEADLFPDALFALPAAAFPWHVAHVRSRQEKLLARRLREQDIPFYLPQVERVVERSSRRFRSYLPLFAGYVFFRGGDQAREAAIRSGVLASIISVDDQELLSAQLEQIHRLQLAGASFELYEELAPNDIVTITEGPFRGYSGAVVRSGRGDRLVVALSLLRKSFMVEFGRAVLRRARR
ncbi:MAG TPA: transcription termination/antitermination NusG family protein [Thermoanaerobaculia bacterium]|nr:transcription termination/antitermination NusG family protein [Thermoanaerobaculia bacterium]